MKSTLSISLIAIFFLFMIIFSLPDMLISGDDISKQQQKIRWARTYGENIRNNSYGYDIKSTKDEGYVIAGMTWAFGAGLCDIWVLKLSTKGEIQWQKSYGGSGYDGYWQVAIHQTRDEGYIVAADTTSFGSLQRKIWIIKLSQSGDIKWQKAYGGFGDELPGGIQVTADGGFVVTGRVLNSDRDNDIWVLKLNSNGEIEWQNTYGDSRYQYGQSIQQTGDEGFIVSGISLTGGMEYDSWILKLDPYGNIQWQKYLNGEGRTSDIQPFSIVRQTSDGGYILVEYTDIFGAGEHDIWLLKLNANGDIRWQKTYGGLDTDIPAWTNPIQQTADGGYILIGHTFSFGVENFACWILKLGPQGSIEWQKTFKGSVGELQQPFSVEQAACGDFIISGYQGRQAKIGYLFLKLSEEGEIGPECDLLSETQAQTSNTETVLLELDSIVKAIDIKPENTNILPQDTLADSTLICWNLCQPPQNVTHAKEVNRSLFIKETYHKLSWSPHSYNGRFTITEYRIYSEYAGKYELVGSVSGNTYEYRAGPISEDENVKYAITSVDSEGNESPKSQTVES